jgi:glutamate N-acetyltransferase / amino-acid N-acetyltransferase
LRGGHALEFASQLRNEPMPVNYPPPAPEPLLPVPGVTLGAAPARIKNWTRPDLLLVSLAPSTLAAGVFTQNRFCAAPVTICR